MQTKMLIDGAFVEGAGAAEQVLAPATGEVLATVHEASATQVDDAVHAAARAFPPWARTSPKERGAMLMRLADAMEREVARFGALEADNCGKPLGAAVNDDLPATIDVLRFFAQRGYGCWAVSEAGVRELAVVDDATPQTNYAFLHRETHAAFIERLGAVAER